MKPQRRRARRQWDKLMTAVREADPDTMVVRRVGDTKVVAMNVRGARLLAHLEDRDDRA